MINLVNLLVEQGILKEDQADNLIKQAEGEAYVSRQAAKDAASKAEEAAKTASAASAAASPPGSKLVAYVPDAKVWHVIPDERLTQSWIRKRAVWQAVSDFMRHGATFEQMIEHHWEQLHHFQKGPIGNDVSTLCCDVGDPAVFKRQILALHELTVLMLAGLRGRPPSL